MVDSLITVKTSVYIITTLNSTYCWYFCRVFQNQTLIGSSDKFMEAQGEFLLLHNKVWSIEYSLIKGVYCYDM